MNTRVQLQTMVAVVFVAFSASAYAQDASPRIEGTWLVQITMRNCGDDSVVGSAFGLNTFVPGGTMLAAPGGPTAAIRNGQGVWTYAGGSRFSNRFVMFAYNPQTGAFAGIRVVTRTIEVGPGPDQFRSRDTDQLYDPATLVPLGPQGCGTGAGRRVP